MGAFADIEAVLFDLGGTLAHYPVPSLPLVVGRCVKGAVTGILVGSEGNSPVAANVPGPEEAQARRRAPRPDSPLPHRVAAALRRMVRSLSGRTLPNMGEMCARPLMAKARLFADSLPTLETLRDRGYRLGLVSNTPWGTPDYLWVGQLERFALAPLFDAACFSSDVGFRKPDARIFQTALDRLRAPARRTLFVGDDPAADIVGAARMGIRTVLIDREGRTAGDNDPAPDLRITTLRELLDHLPGRAKTVDTSATPA